RDQGFRASRRGHGPRTRDPARARLVSVTTQLARGKEELDRELIELLNELRIALPGVQVLFAFLLAVPFANGWKRVTEFQRDVFFVAFVATAVSSAFLIAPSAYHRLGWRVEEKGRIVEASNRLAI